MARLMGQIVSISSIQSWPELERVFTEQATGEDKAGALVLLKNLISRFKPEPVIIQFVMNSLRDPLLASEAL